MKLKELHSLMQDMAPFDPSRLKVQLEQYPTGADIASRMLFTIESMYNDFEGKVVVDLGCGTGMLSAGAALLGSPAVVGVDIDDDALAVALENREQFEDLPVDFVRADVASIAARDGGCAWRRLRCDTVIMNPPFGTRRKGADVDFLRAAARLVRGGGGAIYSLHKSSTRAHLQKVALRELGCSEAQVLAELRYDLPATYKFHKQQSRDIEVDLWRFVVPPGPDADEDEDEEEGQQRRQQPQKQRKQQKQQASRRREVEAEGSGGDTSEEDDDEEDEEEDG
ncbi:methyltransferase [Raphidocelis subcapitata]|uniref:Methyltransferase n=1 Tax=Raphidocelis subcapitata TaxID=307507 RepID=A0A2V0NZS9_9CHLO|nr:methyltransferase [Raphidocelis subcapitata]|eukprot:GBF93134.1 methyltransferase [Raphidocelis subcapitata]